MNTQALTDTQLDEYEALIQRTTPLGAATASPGMAAALLAEIRRLRDHLEDQANADAVASRAAQVISSMGADLRAMTSERNRYRNAWHNARARAVDARSDVEFVEQQPAPAV